MNPRLRNLQLFPEYSGVYLPGAHFSEERFVVGRPEVVARLVAFGVEGIGHRVPFMAVRELRLASDCWVDRRQVPVRADLN